MFCVYFSDEEKSLIIESEKVEWNDDEVVYKDKQGNIVAFFNRSRVKGTIKVCSGVKVI